MARVTMKIYDDYDDEIVRSDEPLYLDEDDIANQAYRLQEHYYKFMETYESDSEDSDE